MSRRSQRISQHPYRGDNSDAVEAVGHDATLRSTPDCLASGRLPLIRCEWVGEWAAWRSGQRGSLRAFLSPLGGPILRAGRFALRWPKRWSTVSCAAPSRRVEPPSREGYCVMSCEPRWPLRCGGHRGAATHARRVAGVPRSAATPNRVSPTAPNRDRDGRGVRPAAIAPGSVRRSTPAQGDGCAARRLWTVGMTGVRPERTCHPSRRRRFYPARPRIQTKQRGRRPSLPDRA
jgi:hypothetical protein